MGPPPFGDGNVRPKAVNAADKTPSMGPPPFGDGNMGVGLKSCSFSPPSMGPPPFGDGNSRTRSAWTGPPCPFNGATAFRRRKRHGDYAQIGDGSLPSMGPPPFGDGNMDTHQLRRSHSLRPSMGPPPFGDGNCQNASRWGFFSSSLQWRWKPAWTGPPRHCAWPFNGATAFRRWKPVWP